MPIGNLFNEEWYLNNNPDVRASVEAGLVDARTHFELHGRFEGRSPDPLFNPAQYLAANPDVQAAVEAGGMTAYDHFVQFGASEGRSPVNLFDPEFYLSQNPDVRAAVEAGLMSATEHFLLHGQNEPRQINPFINLSDYLNANADLKQAADAGLLSPLSHLLTHGAAEGRDLGNGINLSIFANDPAYQEAIQSGNFTAALDRVGEVASFLPSFEPPAGWQPAPDTPIPTDFTPPEGTKLVIPPSVVVPDDMELPDTFEPQPDPAPQPEPSPGPRPQPDIDPSVVAAAGKASGEGGTFVQGDTFIIVFDQPVSLGNTPFTAESAALLGEGYEVERAYIHWDDGSQVPDAPIVQYRVTLGSDPGLRDGDALTFQPGAIINAPSSAPQFHVKGDGWLMLDQDIDYSGWFQLAPDVNYDLGDAVQLAQLADLASPPDGAGSLHTEVVGGDIDQQFVATNVKALMSTGERSLELDGKGGSNALIAYLGHAADSANYAPTISNIATFQLTATEIGAGLDFTNITGVESVWNYSTEHGLTLTHVGQEVHLGASGAGRGDPDSDTPGPGAAYTLQYGAGVQLEDNSQAISLHNSHLTLLSITWPEGVAPSSSDEPFTLEIDISGGNQIDSFTDLDVAEGSRLPDIVKGIELGRMDSQEGEKAIPAVLALGEVWNGLGIDMAELKGGGLATLDLSSAEISGDLTIRIAELDKDGGKSDLGDGTPDNRKSDQVVKLPELKKMGALLLGGPDAPEVTLINFTLASTSGYAHDPQQNDVLDISEWGGNSIDEVAGRVSSIEVSREGQPDEAEPDLLSFSIGFFAEVDSGPTVSFTLHFENLATVEEYTQMLQALDTVNATEDLHDTRDLVGWEGDWTTNGPISSAYAFDETDSVIISPSSVPTDEPHIGDAAIVGLIGIFIDEGSWIF